MRQSPERLGTYNRLKSWFARQCAMGDEVSVKELIQKISEDLLESEQERRSGGRRAVFEVSELTIELTFAVSRSRQGRAGVQLHVVSVDGDAGREDERTQRMTLKLVAAAGAPAAARWEDGRPLSRLDYDDALPVRPRLRQQDES